MGNCFGYFFNFAEVTKYKTELELYYNITQMRISTGRDTLKPNTDELCRLVQT